MVTFKDDSFVIEVSTAGNPIEEWMRLHAQITHVLCLSKTPSDELYCLINLLEDMMPDWKTALEMKPFKKTEQ